MIGVKAIVFAGLITLEIPQLHLFPFSLVPELPHALVSQIIL